MKTNTIQVITATISTGFAVGFGSLAVTGDLLTAVAIAVSCWAVVALLVIAASDYRSGPKGYFIGTVETGYFRPAPVALRAPASKPRVAA